MINDREKILHTLNNQVARLGAIFSILSKIERTDDHGFSAKEIDEILEDATKSATFLNNNINTLVELKMRKKGVPNYE